MVHRTGKYNKEFADFVYFLRVHGTAHIRDLVAITNWPRHLATRRIHTWANGGRLVQVGKGMFKLGDGVKDGSIIVRTN